MQSLDKDKLAEKIGKSMCRDINDGKTSCAEIAVNQCGERIYSKRFGTNGVSGEPLREKMLFRAASLTKPVTSVAVLIEASRGRIDINADLSEYIKEYGVRQIAHLEDGRLVIDGEAKNTVKVHHLLTHTSGIGCGDINGVIAAGLPNPITATLERVVAYYADKPILFEPGTRERYSGSVAFDIAARLVELSSGMCFADYLRVNIFDRLGMTDTVFEPSKEQWRRLVKMHALTADGKAVDKPMPPNSIFAGYGTSYHCGGAGLATTCEDYSAFAEMLLSEGRSLDGEVILPPEYIRLMSTPRVSPEIMKKPHLWGYGCRVIVDESYPLPVGSFGWSGAYGAHFWVDPVNRITAVLMRNSYYDGGSDSSISRELEENVMTSFY